MKIAIGSDHRGFEAKEKVKTIVRQLGHECIDFGTNDRRPVDYPDVAYKASKSLSEDRCNRAILICATGIGMSIAANKLNGVRAALCHDELGAKISRQHNDANVLCVSGEQIDDILLRKVVEVWLDTGFSGGRHLRRIEKIKAIEQNLKGKI